MNLFVKENLERKLKKKNERKKMEGKNLKKKKWKKKIWRKKSGEINPLHCSRRLIQTEHFNWISFYASEKWLEFDEIDVLKMIKDMMCAFDDF